MLRLMTREAIPSRGAASNPANRFEEIYVEPDADWDPEQDPLPRTKFLRDRSSRILTTNDSPDVPFDTSINPYRGCEHGCIYCYARPTHEYLGFSAGLDFETRIMVKEDAPRLLREELSSPRWTPKAIALSGVTDPYQPIERRLKLTRGCLEVLAEFRNPVSVVTKNNLVLRDLDLLSELSRCEAVLVVISLTTLDTGLRLTLHLPAKKDKVLGRIRAMRRGKLNNSQFGLRMRGEGIFAEQMEAMFEVACRKAGIEGDAPRLSTAAFRRPSGRQLSLFQ